MVFCILVPARRQTHAQFLPETAGVVQLREAIAWQHVASGTNGRLHSTRYFAGKFG
jgi:hypothetical protein